MIPDRDIWRAVKILIREYGHGAVFVAARRADEMHEAVWLRIRRAIVDMFAAPPGKPN